MLRRKAAEWGAGGAGAGATAERVARLVERIELLSKEVRGWGAHVTCKARPLLSRNTYKTSPPDGCHVDERVTAINNHCRPSFWLLRTTW